MITGKQRSYLKGLAQKLDPSVYIGKAGLSEMVVKSIDDKLKASELVKVKIQEGCTLDPKETCQKLAEELDAEFVQAIGRRFILYRRAEKKEKRKIILPRA
ncbi:MAG: ribosome assembly RNA-binding protein YhbY [Eubacterium sp.]|jgi:RNA-binding protein|nr:ribosome assembly RNA-binding protein YhbY [Eubacterium sp.]MCH4047117.1 ribosome assembly RNA-binding protein YhbY [Eubacterium sp.]MCH4080214.1 ribosome assembly RNA-binding protein YhbY [Eubacterium sp.]MCH4111185.1 ribosome assembly RNA-binding protein YhbY [Eubacterium sp.]MCI1306845.1 ribosome assembly RNA-binding protein YhbY [Eubacterium sp.]